VRREVEREVGEDLRGGTTVVFSLLVGYTREVTFETDWVQERRRREGKRGEGRKSRRKTRRARGGERKRT